MVDKPKKTPGGGTLDGVEQWELTDAANQKARTWIGDKVARNRAEAQNAGEKEADIVAIHGGRLKERVHIRRLLEWLQQERGIFRGRGADLGAGSGLCTAVISRFSEVDLISAIDYSDDFVEFTMPKVFEALGADQDKIERVRGDFNNLEMPDDSLDFVVELGGFHHSEDIDRTLTEMHRVLKPGGTAVLIEHSNADYKSEADLERMLDRRKPGVDENGNQVLTDITRRSLGIHEYRFSDWVSMLERHGFKVEVPGIWNFHYRTSAKLWKVPKVRGIATLIYYIRLGLFSTWKSGLRKTNCVFLATKI
jgi:ubiquinone/menaquinone biosynthesis C-methylase UbiE